MTPQGDDLDAAVRLGQLERVAEFAAALLERERQHPGTVPDLLAMALHQQVLSWGAMFGLSKP